MGLVFVPTPIGNRGDITVRALETLRDCDILVAEDTRTARRLFALYDLPSKRTISYREQNAKAVTPTILERARSGLVAVVTDAGMPAISDPGRDLVNAGRAAGIEVSVLPGAVAFVCAAVLSGFPLTELRFCGFLPRTAVAKSEALRAALTSGVTYVWYEAPHRMLATLDALETLDPEVELFVARELTKIHEQQAFGTAAAVRSAIEGSIRGEFVIVLGPSDKTLSIDRGDLILAIDSALLRQLSVAAVAREVARDFGIERSRVYAIAVARKHAMR